MSADPHSILTSCISRWFSALRLNSFHSPAQRRKYQQKVPTTAGLESLETRILLAAKNLARNDITNIKADANPNIVRVNVLRNDFVRTGNRLKIFKVISSVSSRNVPQTGLRHLQGRFGRLTVRSNGSFYYKVYQNRQPVKSAAKGQRRIDRFTYRAKNNSRGFVTAKLEIRMIGVNDLPTAVNDSAVTHEDSPISVAVLANDKDIDRDTLTVTAVDSSSTIGDVSLDDHHKILYNPNGQFENLKSGEQANDTFQYTVSDGKGGLQTANVTITIQGVNDPPQIVSAASVNSPENSTLAIDVASTDADGETENGGGLTYHISGGDDRSLFEIDSNTGALSLKSAPDFENPEDADSNNVYHVQITVTDSTGLIDVQNVAINVTNLNEVPTIDLDVNSAGSGSISSFTATSGSAIQFAPLAELADDSGNLDSVTIGITNIQDFGYEFLSASPSGAIQSGDISYNASTGLLTIDPAGLAPLADFQAVLRSVTYDNTQSLKSENKLYVVDAETDAVVEVDLNNGNRRIISDSSLGTGIQLNNPQSLVVSPDGNTIYLVDRTVRALIAVDVSTGDRSIISNSSSGTGAALNYPVSLIINAAGDTAYVVDLSLGGVLAVDIATGNRTVISNSTTGNGTNFSSPQSLVLNTSEDKLYVVDTGLDALVSVELSTGNRTVISSATTGTGTSFDHPQSLALNAAEDTAIVIDAYRKALFSVDLNTGNRTIISNSTTGGGVEFANPVSLVLDTDGETAYVVDADYDLHAVVAVDLDNGDRTLINPSDSGTGLVTPLSLALNSTGTTAYVSDYKVRAVISIDIESGTRSIISDASTGTGSAFSNPQSLVINSNEETAYVIDSGLNTLFAVDLSTGNRTVVSNASTGTGTQFAWPQSITLNLAEETLYVVDGNLKSLIAVDINTGNRTVISSNSAVGSGQNFLNPTSVVLNAAEDTAYLVDYSLDALTAVDIATGNRSIISHSSTGTGPNITYPESLVLNSAGTTAYVVDSEQKALFSIDISTGNRVILSNSVTGTGINFSDPSSIEINAAEDTLYVVDYGTDALIAIDLATGDRTVVSDSATGSGAAFLSLQSVAIRQRSALRGGNRTVTVTANDGDLQSSIATATISVDAVPQITSNAGADEATIDVAEHHSNIIDIDATDTGGETEGGGGLSYTLSGEDASAMSIDSNGLLTFNSAPDYEFPDDVGSNQIYRVTVTVTDASGQTDTQNLRIKLTDVDDITILAGGGNDTVPNTGDIATSLKFGNLKDVAVDTSGNVYFTEVARRRVIRINSDSTITVLAGGGFDTTPNDGDLATSLFLRPIGLTVDDSGRLFFTDEDSDRVIRVNSDGTITVIAGGGADTTPDNGDTATSLDLDTPGGIAVDSSGNVYFTDSGLDRVIRVNSDGTITVMAGGGADTTPDNGDTATSLVVNQPEYVVVDETGNLYFTDSLFDRVVRVNSDGTITVIAGGGVDSSPDNGDLATQLDLDAPIGLAVDSMGNVYFAEGRPNSGADRILRVNTDGSISIIVGGGADGSPNDGDLATDLSLSNPIGVAIDNEGHLYFTELGSQFLLIRTQLS